MNVTIRFGVFVLIFLLLAGCGTQTQMKIETCTWEMSTIQDAGASGETVAWGMNSSDADGRVLSMQCSADKGILMLRDSSGQVYCQGTYSLYEKTAQSTLYRIFWKMWREWRSFLQRNMQVGRQDRH